MPDHDQMRFCQGGDEEKYYPKNEGGDFSD